jgi:hypothetical protein
MCEIRSREKTTKNKPKKKDYDEPHLMANEKTQPIQWTEQPTGALVAASSL